MLSDHNKMQNLPSCGKSKRHAKYYPSRNWAVNKVTTLRARCIHTWVDRCRLQKTDQISGKQCMRDCHNSRRCEIQDMPMRTVRAAPKKRLVLYHGQKLWFHLAWNCTAWPPGMLVQEREQRVGNITRAKIAPQAWGACARSGATQWQTYTSVKVSYSMSTQIRSKQCTHDTNRFKRKSPVCGFSKWAMHGSMLHASLSKKHFKKLKLLCTKQVSYSTSD